ncbi:MAG: hypothetical protein B0D92_02640 [Spirochaeta sp. LUC14_002_19_P3]|nr:MAG: hypothetical protein B0D92_02640 [Spirochaeta sp. LUC14_002_19_P3]
MRWEDFISAHPGTVSLPDDDTLGVLADIRTPDPAWASALKICDTVFQALSKGTVLTEVFYEPVRLPLTISFNSILETGPRRAEYRSGLPVRKGKRITVPVLLTNSSKEAFGHIYLLLVEKNWYIEQWALDISGLPVLEIPKEAPPEPEISTETPKE